MPPPRMGTVVGACSASTRSAMAQPTEGAEKEMADNEMEASEDRNEARDLSMAAGFGAAIGIIVGAVVFAITQNALWIAIGIPFGAAFGIVFGRYLRRMDDNSPLVAIFGPFLIHGHRRDRD